MMVMTRRLLISILIFLPASAQAHTLYIKPELPFQASNQSNVMMLVNGTFWENQTFIPQRRISDASIAGPDGEVHEPAQSQWSDENGLTKLSVTFSQPGSYVVGIVIKPMQVRVAAADFDFYLRYEGLADDARQRAELEEQELPAAERYSKYAKSIIQVDELRTDNYSQVLGHRVEVVPLVNPGALHAGEIFRARILKDGEPLIGELVYASSERLNETTDEGIFKELVAVRSDADGIIEFEVSEAGLWYVRFIHLTRLGDSEHWYSALLVWLGLDKPRIPYESFWATLTFEIQ